MMPKGVDHDAVIREAIKDRIVQKSLMPKGVDHHAAVAAGGLDKLVQKSLMPKGVDHGRYLHLQGKVYYACKNL